MQHHSIPAYAPTDADPARRPGPFTRMAQAVAARFGMGMPEHVPEPFRDSDFEGDSGFFGRPLGDH